jgi:peptidoglycan hydrolase-like protein with peptidoglycan-binding domain
LDAGFYPWDYFPYYASDYYPYDYYSGYDGDVESEDYNGAVSPYADQSVDPNITAAQARLAKLGYYRGAVDGLFGPDTRAALTRFQVDHHLRVTGGLTTDTLQSLGIQS